MANAAPPAERPVTRTTLIEDLRALGLRPGATVLVHASLSRVGTVYGGGTQAVIEAFGDVLGPGGTLMMPAHSGDLSDPARWQAPPAPPGTADAIRDAMPAWDPGRTPTRQMGILAEHFRNWPGVRRSDHPQVSFAALGPAADDLLATHRTGDGLGESSPIGRLYALDGEVLLIGVGHGNDTSLHLAEYRADWPSKAVHTEGAPRLVDGVRRWCAFEELVWTDDDFVAIGEAFEADGAPVRTGRVGAAQTRRFRQRPLVDFATAWMTAHRR
jgi:aminoglycoside 3-N-acetyltransferase